jgi:hypothetical protein
MLVSGYSILKGSNPYFSSIKYPVSSIQYLANCGINDRFHDVVIFGSGLSGSGNFNNLNTYPVEKTLLMQRISYF